MSDLSDAAQTVADLAKAVDEMADKLAGIDTGEFFTKMTCDELDSVASVLRLGGRPEVANFITQEHALGDNDEDDKHHDLYEALTTGAVERRTAHEMTGDLA